MGSTCRAVDDTAEAPIGSPRVPLDLASTADRVVLLGHGATAFAFVGE
jgi:hypothetical protein